MVEAHGPWHPPFGGEYGRDRLVEGEAPMAPPNLGFILVSFTSTFTDILGLIWLVNRPLCFYNLPCNKLTRLPIFFSRFLLSRNYKIQIVAHVGRKRQQLTTCDSLSYVPRAKLRTSHEKAMLVKLRRTTITTAIVSMVDTEQQFIADRPSRGPTASYERPL